MNPFRCLYFQVCQPIMSDGTDCNNVINLHRYVENFTCSNPAVTEKMLKDMRMSFPSANSSFSFYTMLFCAVSCGSNVFTKELLNLFYNLYQLYLDSRISWRKSKLLSYFLQLILITAAMFTALSRISDYKHHCKFSEH